MTNISLDVSKEVQEEKIAALRCIKTVADELDIPFFVVGAFARDIVYDYIYGIPARRRTEDIDISVEVNNWDEFEKLTGTLIERKCISATKLPHRFVTQAHGVCLDIIPYGGITDGTKKISWPPEHDVFMDMIGFEEAYNSALKVCLTKEPILEILVPSVPALVFLKLLSWADGYPERERDAQDLLFMLENFDATGIEDEIYEDHVPLLTEEGYDARLVAIRLLGRQIAKVSSETAQAIINILSREVDEADGFRLLAQMVKGAGYQGTQFETAHSLLQKLLQGLQEQVTAE